MAAADLAAHYRGSVYSGADPEIFVVDQNGIIIPAFSFLPPQKKAIKIGNNWKGNDLTIYNDGFQAEFTVPSGCCHSVIVDDIRTQLQAILKEGKKVDPKAQLCCSSTMDIPEHMMQQAADADVILGCAPSNNAYALRGKSIISGREIPMRWAGWHFHIGTSDNLSDKAIADRCAKSCDLFVGIASIVLFGDRERKERRQFYGMPGEYRLPKHGFEYRSVSSMVGYHPVWVQLLMDVMRWAYTIGQNGLYQQAIFKEENVIAAIIESDVKAARRIIKKNEEIWRAFLLKRYHPGQYSYSGRENRAEDVMRLLLGKAQLQDAGSLEKNWRLDQAEANNPHQTVEIEKFAADNRPEWLLHSEAPNCSVMRMLLA